MTETSMTELQPGWYADPWHQARWRYWTGARWTRATSGVAPPDGDVGRRDALRKRAMSMPAPWPPPLPMVLRDRRVDLPASAFGWGMLGLLIGIVGSAVGAIVVHLLTDSLAVEVVVSQSLLWLGLIGAVVFNARRYGTGRIRDDYQVGFRGVDVPIGLGLSLGLRIATGVIAVVVLLLLGADATALPNVVDDYRHSTAALVVTIVIVVVGAPVVEELFFRGVLMRSLEPSLRPGGAIVVQALIFGSLHVNPNGTWQQNVALTIALAAAGAGLGATAYVAKRLGTSMWTHGFFNTFAAVVIVANQLTVLGPLLRT